jgi:hypothetical protein
MNRELVEKWVAALRSGDYQQTVGKLGRDYNGERSYCCLGVLCELAAKEELIPEATVSNDTVFYNHNVTMPPEELDGVLDGEPFTWNVKTPEGLREEHPRQTISLVDLNDTFYYSFNQIADLIETTYLKENA